MKCWIVCTGENPEAWPARCDAAGFEAAVRRAAEGIDTPRTGKKLNAEDCVICCAPSPAARQTAALCFSGGELREEPLLKPVEERAFRSGGVRSLRTWREMARLQRALGDKRQPESKRQITQRAEELIGRLYKEGKDVMLVADRLLAEALLDRLRAYGCDVSRSEIFRLKPWERILVTDRALRCGICVNNCLLANPGCARGLDKARQMKRKNEKRGL